MWQKQAESGKKTAMHLGSGSCKNSPVKQSKWHSLARSLVYCWCMEHHLSSHAV